MDQRRVVLAVVLSLAVLLIYSEVVVRPRQRPGPELPPSGAPEAAPPTIPAPVPRATPAQPAGEGYLSFDPGGETSSIVVETDVLRAIVTRAGGRLTNFALKGFRRTVDPDSPLLDLVEPGPLLPLTVKLSNEESDAGVTYSASAPSLTLSGSNAGELVLTGNTASGLEIRKTLHFQGDTDVIDVTVGISSRAGTVGLVLPRPRVDRLTSGSAPTEMALVLAGGKLVEKHLTEGVSNDLEAETYADSSWVGFSQPYFLSVIIAPDPSGGKATVEQVGSMTIASLERPLADGVARFKLFVGPKTQEVLKLAGFDLGRALDFGWFWFIALPMLYLLRLLHRVSGNYGIDIILLTTLVRVATLPLTQKSFRSMKDMQKLQPQLKRLQEQYKDDQTRLQKEMMELYKRHKVNPFSGCAPMLLQIPIFVGLYNALLHAIELRHAPFMLWITDLSAPERLVVAGIGVPVLTILMGGTMVLQQWLSPQQADPTQRQIMMIMPLMFTFMFINFPSGLVLYWLVSNVLGIAQQYIMLKRPN